MQNIRLVVSVAGTSSLEAALKGIPSLTFIKMYFHNLMVVDSFDPYNEKIYKILEVLEDKDNHATKKSTFKKG